jgi:hypothetical protein
MEFFAFDPLRQAIVLCIGDKSIKNLFLYRYASYSDR